MIAKIELQRLTLRLITHKDNLAISQILNDQQVALYNDYTLPLSRSCLKNMIQSDITAYYENTGVRYVIINNQTTKIIGCIGLYNIKNAPEHSAFIGFELTPAYWNYGFMSEVLSTFLPCMIKQYAIKKVLANVHSDNTDCHKLLRKFDFNLINRTTWCWC
jgi:ribosomal-protein-alanine N-acetyltransferase